MTHQNPRPPTPSVYRTSPLYDVYGQTLYPYINLKSSGLTPYLTAFKKAIASINPFALQQVPTTDSIAYGQKFGQKWWLPDPYPTRVVVQKSHSSHYDPMKNPKYKAPISGQPISILPTVSVQYYPRHCTRTLDAYKTCLIANDDENKCKHEGQDILAICPSWALDKMKQNERLKLKIQAFSNKKYSKVMEIPSYNAGRSVADVPLRNWSDGQRSKLRPNSIWADDRYVDITQKEIDEAKQRVKKRNIAKGIQTNSSVHYAAYDRTYEAPATQLPLYP